MGCMSATEAPKMQSDTNPIESGIREHPEADKARSADAKRAYRKRDAPPVPRRAYQIGEFCRAFRVSRSAFYSLVRAGKLKTVHVAGRHLIPVDEAEKLLAEAM